MKVTSFSRLALAVQLLFIGQLLFVEACGNNGDEALVFEPAADVRVEESVPRPNSQQADAGNYWAPFLRSTSYTGKLAVMFTEGAAVRLVNGKFASLTRVSVTAINQIIEKSPGVRIERGMGTLTDEAIASARMKAQERGGHLDDWSSYFYLVVVDPMQAETIIRELARQSIIRFIHPSLKPTYFGTTTPDVGSMQQPYLQGGQGGLNIMSAWSLGLSGQGVKVVDVEGYWNFTHEDLSIKEGMEKDGGDIIQFEDSLEKYSTTDPATQHGTAVVGLIAARDNKSGMKGIAHGAIIKLIQTPKIGSGETALPFNIVSGMVAYLNGDPTPGAIMPGDIMVVETGTAGPKTPFTSPDTQDCEAAKQFGCLPIEAEADTFLAVQNAVENDVSVVEAAGNGTVDLGSPAGHLLGGPQLASQTSGAIMVGASTGASMEKLPVSNCGKRVDVYAWGQGVATTGYGDYLPGVKEKTESNVNQWYTTTFGGTSAATAQIAGMAALLQEYVRQLYGPTIKPWEDAYLNSAQLRDVLVKAGAGQNAKNTNGCEIGVQPDLGKALDLLKTGVVKPTIKPVKQMAFAKPFDVDGDKRADLISFSRDHKWYADLSSKGSGGDNYGSWDLVLDPGVLPDGMYFPVVGDYNTDGKADLAVYNSTTGQWYIRYTDSQILAGQWGTGWNKVIDYSADINWQPYSRPVPGDYDGADKKILTTDLWLDPAIVTPNGHLLIDIITQAEASQSGEVLGTCERNVTVLSSTQLAGAPGWAYAPFTTGASLSLIVPPPMVDLPQVPSFAEQGTVFGPSVEYKNDDGTTGMTNPWTDLGEIDTASVFTMGKLGVGFKQPNGSWWVDVGLSADGEKYTGYIDDGLDFGNLTCRPVQADFDGDGALDRAVQCPSEWRIEYSDHIFPPGVGFLRTVPMPTTNKPLDPLPGYVYPGGVAYADVKSIIEYYLAKLGCKTADGKLCTVFDLTKTTNPATGQLYSPPVGPYLPQCLKYWSTQPLNCLQH